jgi:hypothetical protein
MVLAPQDWVGHYITRGVDWDNSHLKLFAVGACGQAYQDDSYHTTAFLYYFVCKISSEPNVVEYRSR